MVLLSAMVILLLASFIYVLLCGQAECHRGGVVGKLNHYLRQGVWRDARRALPRSMTSLVDSTQAYCCSSRNPLFQILYVGIILSGFGLFCWSGWQHIPGPHLAFWHKYTSVIAVFGTIAVFFRCVYSDSGIMTRDNVHLYQDNYPFDGVLYGKKHCKTCKIDRPARSKHCKMCGVCVARFDHHCVWISNCVGERNVRKFISMLLCTAFLCTYTTWGMIMMLWGIMEEHNLIGAMVRNRKTGEIIPMPYHLLFSYLVKYSGFLMTLVILAGVMGVVLYIFAGYHLYLVARNTTTSETFKWSDIKADVKAAKSILSSMEKARKANKGSTAVTGGQTHIDVFGKSASEGIRRTIFYRTGVDLFGYEKLPEDFDPKPMNPKDADVAFIAELERLSTLSLENKYNNGVLENFKEILFPLSERKEEKAAAQKKRK